MSCLGIDREARVCYRDSSNTQKPKRGYYYLGGKGMHPRSILRLAVLLVAVASVAGAEAAVD